MKRCLFLGLGGVGQRHLRNLRQLRGNDVEVLAYRVRGESQVLSDDLKIVPGKELEREYGVSVFGDLDAALAQRPEVAFIANPSSLHVPTARRAAEAGCHLFIEKPLSASMDGVSELADYCEQRRLVAHVAYQLRFHPGFIKLRALLAERRVGRLLFVRAEVGEYLPGFHPYEDYRRMYAARGDLGGGVTLSQIHEIDYLMALFGRPERIFSMGGHCSQLEIDVDDLACSLLEVTAADGHKVPISLHQDYLQRPAQRRCLVVGEAGRIEWNLSEKALRVHDVAGRELESVSYADVPRNLPYLLELEHFLGAVRGLHAPEVSLNSARDSLRVALGALTSQKTGQPVLFDWSAAV